MSLQALASELGWSEVPAGAAGTALELLLDDEFDRLKRAERDAFIAQVREQVPTAEGTNLAVCASCSHAILARYVGQDCKCRACGAALDMGGEASAEDSGFGFTLSSYGSVGATLLSEPPADPEGGRLELHKDRGLDEAFALDPDNKDWDELQDEIEARRKAAEDARIAAAKAAEAAAKAAEEAKIAAAKAAEEAKIAAAKAAAEAAAEKARLAAEAEAEKARLAAEAEAEKVRLAAEEAARQKAAEEARLAAEEAARKKAAEEARLAAEEAERARIAELEKARPALGCVAGERAGEVVRIEDLEGEPGPQTAFYVVGWPETAEAILSVGDVPAQVDGKEVSGRVTLELGAVVTLRNEAYVVEETQEMGGQQAAAVHIARNDKKPGGPWAYWNEEVSLGALSDSKINIVDDGVADLHARMLTRFGIVVLEDESGQGSEDGVFVEGERRPWLLLHDGVTFRLGPRGPQLIAKEGAARQKAGQKAKAMKPARHNRTVFDIYDAEDQLLQRVFVFVRREVRFGAVGMSPDDDTRLLNEWVLQPAPHESAEIADKQGGLALTREGVDIRRDGGAEMILNGEPLVPGSPQLLRRRFDLEVGERMTFDGRVYRSPSAVDRDTGPARLGMKGGHPTECVRLDRVDTNHTYVFMVRMLRIGSESFAPLRIDLPGVEEAHCQIMFNQGKFLIVAPKANAPVFLGDVEVDTGIAFPLEINTDLHVGEARLRFREIQASDFLWGEDEGSADEDADAATED